MWVKSRKASVVLMLILAMISSGIFEADELDKEDDVVVYDCTSDPEEYRKVISTLNQQIERSSSKKKSESKHAAKSTAVLCKTDGASLELFEEGLVYEVVGPNSCFTLYYSSEAYASEAVDFYLQNDLIIYAEIDGDVYANSTGSDLHSWGAEEMNFYKYISFADQWGEGSSIVSIIDSGVCQHPFLDGKIWGNGYDYIDADDDSTNDLFGHGTHVAGIVADCAYDLPVYLYPIRVLDSAGRGKISNVVNAINEASEKQVDIINLSLETQIVSTALDTAILDAVDAGTVVVASAGNSNMDTENVYPAHLKQKGVIVVGAAEKEGDVVVKASYSNYGESVDLYAYGTNILSCSRSGGYVTDTGTSMAAPHISALCAMLKLIHPELLPEEIEDRILKAGVNHAAVNVPDLINIIPEKLGFYLDDITIAQTDLIQLPVEAYPETACEVIRYTSSDSDIISVDNGLLKALNAGNAEVEIECTGFPPAAFNVAVKNETDNILSLPGMLKEISDEAYLNNVLIERIILPDSLEVIGDHVFEGCTSLRMLSLPDSLLEIGDNDFSNVVLLCDSYGIGSDYAEERNYQYIVSS